jgi:PAS domain-containing protein
MDVALAGVAASPLFLASPAPYVLLDRRLRIRAVDAAYLKATNRSAGELVGADMFELFPDKPADPGADGVARLSFSLDHVLRHGLPMLGAGVG